MKTQLNYRNFPYNLMELFAVLPARRTGSAPEVLRFGFVIQWGVCVIWFLKQDKLIPYSPVIHRPIWISQQRQRQVTFFTCIQCAKVVFEEPLKRAYFNRWSPTINSTIIYVWKLVSPHNKFLTYRVTHQVRSYLQFHCCTWTKHEKLGISSCHLTGCDTL